jgi:glyoxylate reductase
MKKDVETKKKKVFITRPILPEGLEYLQSNGIDFEMRAENSPISGLELKKKALEVDALITMLSDPIDKDFLEKSSHLKVITNCAVGFNNIDIKTATELRIPIGNTPDVLTEATAEIAFGLMIACARNFKTASKDAMEGRWGSWHINAYIGQGLRGKTLAIIGYGRIGKRVAKMGEAAFGMKILSFRSKDTKEKLAEILSSADIISIHTPLVKETRNLISTAEFSLMKPTAILINTSRGEVLDQDALYIALKNKTIWAAGLDVTTPEPLSPDHPLYKLDNTFILPHIGSATIEARTAMSVLAAKNIVAGLSGDLSQGNFINKSELSL